MVNIAGKLKIGSFRKTKYVKELYKTQIQKKIYRRVL